MIKSIKDLVPGMSANRAVTITEGLIRQFVQLTGDDAPVHLSDDHAKALGFKSRIVHGLLIGSMYSELLGCQLPGPNSVILKLSLDMVKPVQIGETVAFSVVINSVSEGARSVTLGLAGASFTNGQVSRGTAVCVFRGQDINEQRDSK
jgi:acyl dehydratase